MRWIVALVALAGGAWYFSSRRRRDRAQDAPQRTAPPDPWDRASSAANSAANTVARHAQGVAEEVSRSVGDAAANVQQTSAAVVDQTQQAAQTATDTVHHAAQTATDTVHHAAQAATDAAQQATQAATGAAGAVEKVGQATADTEPDSMRAPAGAVETDVDAPAPSVHATVQAEMADVNDTVDSLRARGEQPVDPAEDSAMAAPGTPSVADVVTAEHADTLSAGARSAPEAGGATDGDSGSGPEGRRPRPIAGEGTTTARGGRVDPLSPIPDGPSATGTPDPLPDGLRPGDPGTGGPAASTIAPSVPDAAESPTVGMEQPPEIDRAAEVAERTSGNFVGNKNTRIFHAATASNLPGEKNRVYFETEEEALAAGFQPAANEDLESATS